MQFLVRIRIALPLGMADSEREAVYAAERRRGRELIEAGHLLSIWRVPGTSENVSVYDVESTTQLHELLTSLPLWPWMHAEVQALAAHPLNATEQ
ncbi:muconolactone Delta-isomerase [Microbacterium sp.]|uniref:muconolactone Delta-isomerase n=1 Tax=Microbacterium sp. TaxID=51671 RepID=UPI003F985BDC